MDEASLAVLDQGNELEIGLNELDRSIDARRCRCDASKEYRRAYGRGSARVQQFHTHESLYDNEVEVLDVPVRRCRLTRPKQVQPCLEDRATAVIS